MMTEMTSPTGRELPRAKPDEITIRVGAVASGNDGVCHDAKRSAGVEKVTRPFHCPECQGKLLLAGSGVVHQHGFSLAAVCRNCGTKVRWCGTRSPNPK
jgi:hypothetical protein